MLIASGSSETSELFVLDLNRLAAVDQSDVCPKPTIKSLLTLVRAREFGVRYDVCGIAEEEIFVLTNIDNCINNKLVVLQLAMPSDWSNVVIAHDPAIKLDSCTVLARHSIHTQFVLT